eukprot:SAG11_NODE_39513_length_230_cov_3.122137_1_plen_48_part_01
MGDLKPDGKMVGVLFIIGFRSVAPRQPAACTKRASFFLEIFVCTRFSG